jgi:LIVCS family branched-chain amino acid:cation transporter
MFFGSGNLVFPLQIGQDSGLYWLVGFLGLFLTGILLPFLGLYVIKLFGGDYYKFFAQAGKLTELMLPLFTLSLLGAFGVVPRCVTVAHGGMAYIIPGLSLELFSILFCIVCFFLCLKDRFMIAAVGKWLSPLIVIGLLVIMALGVMHAPENIEEQKSALFVFRNGFIFGYQTMDLFSAFFFSALIFKQIQDGLSEKAPLETIIKAAIKPSLVGIVLLGGIYLGMVWLGSAYRSILVGVEPELLLPTIVTHIFGKQAAWLIGIVMTLSCLTTAVALNNVYARYLCNLFKLKSDNMFKMMLLITTVISFFVSLLDFKGIAKILGPALEVSYPSIIFLTLMCIFMKYQKSLKTVVFYGTLGVMMYLNFWA